MPAKVNPSVELLSRMLFGITETAVNYGDEETPDVGMNIVEADDETIVARLQVPSGDVFLLTLSWMSEESP